MNKIELTKKIILICIILIGLYSLLRNNVFRFPDQLMWITSRNLFYGLLIPLLMIISSIVAFVQVDKVKYFYVSFTALAIDAIYRLSLAINHLYGYIQFIDIPIPPPSSGVIKVNYWPSHIILIIEVVLLLYCLSFLKYLKRKKKKGWHLYS